MQQPDIKTLREAALSGGMVPLLGDALAKIRQGRVALEDVQRRVDLGDVFDEE